MAGPTLGELLPGFSRLGSPVASCQAVFFPSAGQWLVAPLVRALRVPSHFGLLAASLSFVAEPTSFAAEPKARAASVHRQFLASVHRQFLASTPPVSGGTGTCHHRTPAHLSMADLRAPQPQLSQLTKCEESALNPSRPLEVDGHIAARRNGVTLTQMVHCLRNLGLEK